MFYQPHGGHVFQQTGTIFELVQDIIGTNLLTKFHEDPTINVASKVLTMQIFMTQTEDRTIDKRACEDTYDVHKTHVLTKFHENWTKNVTSKKIAPPPGGHDFSPIWTIFELVRDINETNVLTKFHDDWAKIVNPKVFTRFPYQWGHLHEDWASNVTSTLFTSFSCFTYFELINRTNVPTKFREDRTINANDDGARRTTDKRRSQKITVSILCSDPLPHGGHVFLPIRTIFELNRHIQETNVLTKFQIILAENVSSSSDILKSAGPKNVPPPDIIGRNLLTIFHDDRTINMASRVLTRSLFHDDRTINLASRVKNAPPPDIIGTNLLTKFHEDRKIKVASKDFTMQSLKASSINNFISHDYNITRVLKMFYYSHIWKNAPPLGDHFHKDWTINVASRVLTRKMPCPCIRTNLITKFHDNRTINVASRVLTRKNDLTKFQVNWTINVISRVLTRFYYSHVKKNAPHRGRHAFQPNGTISN
ncbi:hypothetical protein DPMN_149711 [Dreissena polymorpha]|uniref:Uncharacterized protein n=1 Tax=Dreissena polymorpha TaxID=45954 RepID=A0A9D4J4Y5_DREPO|nr:hypothetical protein DPMN_149711 [Dreissena polymorpha]